jgi:hypothetical protein
MTTKAIIKAELADQEKAEIHFRTVLNRGAGRADVLAVFAEQPSAALARLNDTKALTDRGAADILDEVVGQVPNSERARELLEQELPPERLRTLLLARGDLPSSAAYIVSLSDLVHVVLNDLIETMRDDEEGAHVTQVALREVRLEEMSIEEIDANNERAADETENSSPSSQPNIYQMEINSPMPLYVMLNWAYKLKDREDFPEFLETQLGAYSVKQIVALALWHNSGCPLDLSEMAFESFDDLGINPDEAESILTDLLESNPPTFSRGEIEDARLGLTKRRQTQAAAPTLVDKAREEAEKLAEDLDF